MTELSQSDIRSKAEFNVVIVQPWTTHCLEKVEELGKLKNDQEMFEEIYETTVENIWLKLVGILRISESKPISFDFYKKDDKFNIENVESEERHGTFHSSSELRTKFHFNPLRSSRDKPELHLYSRLSIEEQKINLLHLMIKQMVPSLPMCNYIVCDQEIETRQGRKTKLGLISLSTEKFENLLPVSGSIHGERKKKGEFIMGFTLLPGMNTLESCDGYDKWLRFLLGAKFGQMRQLQKSIMPQWIGPKQG